MNFHNAGVDSDDPVRSILSKELPPLHGLNRAAAHLAFSRDECHVVATSGGEVIVWSVPDARECLRFTAHDKWIANILYAENDALLVTAGSGDTIAFWDARTGAKVRSIKKVNFDGPRRLSLSFDGRLLAICDKLNRVRIFRLPDCEVIAEAEVGEKAKDSSGFVCGIENIQFSPSGPSLLISDPKGVLLVDPTNLTPQHRLTDWHKTIPPSFSFSPSGEHIVARVPGGGVNLLTAPNWQITSSLHLDEDNVHQTIAVAVSADGRFVLINRYDGGGVYRRPGGTYVSLEMWRVDDAHMVLSLPYVESVNDMKFSVAGRFFATASCTKRRSMESDDGPCEVRIWDWASSWGSPAIASRKLDAADIKKPVPQTLAAIEATRLISNLHGTKIEDQDAAIRSYVARSGGINVFDSDGWSLLHRAAFRFDPVAVAAFLRAGADPNIGAESGASPLEMARHNSQGRADHVAVIRMLEDAIHRPSK